MRCEANRDIKMTPWCSTEVPEKKLSLIGMGGLWKEQFLRGVGEWSEI